MELQKETKSYYFRERIDEVFSNFRTAEIHFERFSRITSNISNDSNDLMWKFRECKFTMERDTYTLGDWSFLAGVYKKMIEILAELR